MGVLQKILSGEEAFDMDRMNTQIHRQILEEMNSVCRHLVHSVA